ncbi:hypothetical protein ABT324_00765 [Saccharopolyspora sp. NPDC000359]|uniref:hypothetical protein n=1 Tax=Saccharopolyspora sp. NPDC000359 TaxID=3154251 RepID=UPI00331DEE48
MLLRCDDPDCTALYLDDTTTCWVLRLRAREDGWCIDERGDFCPNHADEVKPHGPDAAGSQIKTEMDAALTTFRGLVMDRLLDQPTLPRLKEYIEDGDPSRKMWMLTVGGALSTADLTYQITGFSNEEAFYFLDAGQLPSDADANEVAATQLWAAALNDDPALGSDILSAHHAVEGDQGIVAVIQVLMEIYRQLLLVAAVMA